MSGKGLLLVFGLVLASVLAVSANKAKSMIIGDHLYFNDNTVNRNRAQALDYCVLNGGELAKVNSNTKNFFNLLRMSLPTAGSYWIDGIDKQTADRFSANETCTPGTIDFDAIPAENVDLPASNCLTLLKGTTEKNSKIQAVACTSQLRGVICSYPLAGCADPTTPPTTSP